MKLKNTFWSCQQGEWGFWFFSWCLRPVPSRLTAFESPMMSYFRWKREFYFRETKDRSFSFWRGGCQAIEFPKRLQEQHMRSVRNYSNFLSSCQKSPGNNKNKALSVKSKRKILYSCRSILTTIRLELVLRLIVTALLWLRSLPLNQIGAVGLNLAFREVVIGLN